MTGPLTNLEQWDDFVASRYDPNKAEEQFRDYSDAAPGVREFYRLNHANQTRDFVLEKKRQYFGLDKARWGSGKRWSI